MEMKRMCELMSRSCGEDWKKVEGHLMEVWESMSVDLPWCCYENQEEEEKLCGGLEKAGGLWLRCSGSVESEGLCKKCKKSCRVSEGEPRLGLWKKRLEEGSGFKAKGKVKTWGKYLKEKGKTKEDGLKILELRGIDLNTVPDSEWVTEVKPKKKSGMGITARFVPLKGKSRSVSRKSGNYFKHVGLETGCQVHFIQESGKVKKVSCEKWPEAAHAKFVEMYGEPDEEGFGVDKPKKKEKVTSNNETEFAELMRLERAKMAAELEAEKEKLRLEFEKKLRPETSLEPPAPETKTSLPESSLPKRKKLKMGKKNTAALRAAEDAKKVKKLVEEKRLAEAKKKEEEEEIARKLKEEEEKKHKETTVDTSASELDDDEFEDSDDEEGFVFNPYEYNGIKYHLDDGELYHFPPNEEGEVLQYGTLHEDGTVTEM